jgi:hypothetical protein
MHVAVGTDQQRHVNPVAADLAHQIAEDGEAGDDLDPVGGMTGRRQQRQRQDRNDKPANRHDCASCDRE